ncbi:MAG: hypothetical protein HY656_08645 [Acidobacteria bacterium]|nr:hypothetical protein [Acidobacteriota bacterium]
MVLWPLLLGYGWVLFALGRTPRRSALRVVVLFSVLGLVLTVSLLAAAFARGEGIDPVAMGLLWGFGVVQAGLGVSSLKLYRTVLAQAAPPRREKSAVVFRVLLALGLLLSVLALLPNLLPPSRKPANESAAVGTLRTINTSAVVYEDTYKTGYPPSLKSVGPPEPGGSAGCNQADFIDAVVVSGEKSGYRFEYRAGPRVEKAGEGCTVPGGQSYQVTARPLKYRRTGIRSFFTDGTGVIRGTTEDRAATAQDPPL